MTDISIPPATDQQIGAFRDYMRKCLEKDFDYPTGYLNFVKANHGIVPRQACFETRDGRLRLVGRYLNFLRVGDIKPPVVPTWRWGVDRSNPKPTDDIRLNYSVWSNSQATDPHSMTLDSELVPFAAIDTSGHNPREMAEFDLLCFRYTDDLQSPSVVAWSFHESSEDESVYEAVADSFEEFEALLHLCPPDIQEKHVDSMEHF